MTPSRSASQPPGTQQNSSALLHIRATGAQQTVVAGELPVAVDLHDAAHLSVGRGFIKVFRLFQGQVYPEAHQPVIPNGLGELDLAHLAG